MRVLLMRTCMSDLLAPSVARAARTVLERAGIEVVVPRGQTCCGQPAWTAGHPEQARAVARRTLRAFADADQVVVPSGSCAGMVVHAYPELFAGTRHQARARRMAERTCEFSQFVARHGLQRDNGAGGSIAYHDSCHMLRILGENATPRTCIDALQGVELREMAESTTCCGFGGTFSLNYPEVSGRLGEEKAQHAADTGADELIACDMPCLAHIAGRAHRLGIPLRVRHLAELMADGPGPDRP